MVTKFEIKGVWWLPQNTEAKFPGILNFSAEGGISLELHGSFYSNRLTDVPTPDVILGDTYQGRPVTVCDCFQTQNDGRSSRFVGNEILLGKHFVSCEHIRLSGARVNYQHLEEWLSGWRFKRNLPDRPFWRCIRLLKTS